MRRSRPLVLVAAASVALAGACGGGSDAGDAGRTVTGRVMRLDAERACVSPDRGVTRRCLDVTDPADVEGVDVGECAELADGRLRVVDEAACAAGDLGDGAGR